MVQNLTDAEDTKNICSVIVLRQGRHVIEVLLSNGIPDGQQRDEETAEEAAIRIIKDGCGIDTSVERLTEGSNQKSFYAVVDAATEATAGAWTPITRLDNLNERGQHLIKMAVKRVYDPEALVREAIEESAQRFPVHALLDDIAPRGSKGFLIALEGEDVRQHSQAIVEHLRERGLPCRIINGNLSLVAEAALQTAHRLRKLNPLTEAIIKAADALHRLETQVLPALDSDEHVIVEHWICHDRKACLQRGLEPDLFEALFRFLPEPDATFQISGESTQEIIDRFAALVEDAPLTENATQDQLMQFCAALTQEAKYDEEIGHHYWLRNGEYFACGVCTSSAQLIAKTFGGQVFGYHTNESDDKNLIGFDCGGHDFAMVGNFLVDWWAHEYEQAVPAPVMTLEEALATGKYKPRKAWTLVEHKLYAIKPPFPVRLT